MAEATIWDNGVTEQRNDEALDGAAWVSHEQANTLNAGPAQPITNITNGYGLYIGRRVHVENLYVLDLTIDRTAAGGGIIAVRIRPDGHVEYEGAFDEATRAFFGQIGQAVAWAQSQELVQLRAEVERLRAEASTR